MSSSRRLVAAERWSACARELAHEYAELVKERGIDAAIAELEDDAKPLARGKQGPGDKPGENDTVVVWKHEYGPKKTRVFSTTLGHNNETVADARYLDLITRGLLWSVGKLDDAHLRPAAKVLIEQ